MASPNIFQAYLQPPKSILDYRDEYERSDALKNQNAMQALALQQATAKTSQDLQERNALQRVAEASRGNRNALITGLRNSGLPGLMTQADSLEQSGAKLAESQATAKMNNATAEKTEFGTQVAKTNKQLADIASFGNRNDALASIQQHVQSGKITPEQAQAAASTLPKGDDPAEFRQWQINMLIHTLDNKDAVDAMKPQSSTVNTGGAQQFVTRDPISGAVRVVGNVANTVSPDTVATQAGEDRRSNQSRNTQLLVAGIDPQNANGPSAAALTPAAIENAAARYNLDGTLPPMAMGPRGAVGRTAIMNRAAELTVGTDPTQLRVNQLDAKSAGSALTQLTKAKTMSAAFEDTANKNADLALALSKQNDRTGIPLLNAGLQAWRTGTGSPEATQFAAANETFVNEYAKIMSGGMGNGPVSDAARNKAHTLLTTGMTDGQYEANVRLLQKEMRNRMAGFDDQEKALRARLSGKPASSGAPASTTSTGATVSNW